MPAPSRKLPFIIVDGGILSRTEIDSLVTPEADLAEKTTMIRRGRETLMIFMKFIPFSLYWQEI